MNINEIYKSTSNFLRAEDLKGARVTVEIAGFTVETLKSDEGEKKQVVLSFTGKEKVLGLNKTNAERIAALSGSYDPSEWAGAKIKLFPTKTTFQGREVDCIRVSEEYFEPAPGKAAAVTEASADEVPF